MTIKKNIAKINKQLAGSAARLIAVTKTKPIEDLQEAYQADCKLFGENRVQEMVNKWKVLPKDIEWHLIGHLQGNKVKEIVPFVSLIHSVDSIKLLKQIDFQAAKINRTVDCLLQIYIAQEDTKFGLSEEEAIEIIESEDLKSLQNIKIVGLMGMATFTDNLPQIRREFKKLKTFFDVLKTVSEHRHILNVELKEISMGMSGDYQIAIEEGSTLIRVGSFIFGNRSIA
jgi:PLP dependent protein